MKCCAYFFCIFLTLYQIKANNAKSTQRISLRDKVFREIVSNLLIHREYLNPFPAKLIIEYDKLVAENGNSAHTYGLMTPTNFTPFPKNPIIGSLFREIGMADELGSGIHNLFRYTREYAGSDPQIIEEDIFRVIIPFNNPLLLSIPHTSTEQATMQPIMQADYQSKAIEFCKDARFRNEIQKYLGLKNRDYFRIAILNPLIESGQLKLTIPDKPKSPNQKYIAEQATMQADYQSKAIEFCKEARSRNEIQEYLGLKNRDYFRINILNPLIESEQLKLTIPDKPKSPNQKYISN